MLVAPEIDAVAPVDGETDPTADVAETPEIEAEILGATLPAVDVPVLPTRDADGSPPAETPNKNCVPECCGSIMSRDSATGSM